MLKLRGVRFPPSRRSKMVSSRFEPTYSISALLVIMTMSNYFDRIDETEIRSAYDRAGSLRELLSLLGSCEGGTNRPKLKRRLEELGFSVEALISKGIAKKSFSPIYTEAEIFCEGSTISRTRLKRCPTSVQSVGLLLNGDQGPWCWSWTTLTASTMITGWRTSGSFARTATAKQTPLPAGTVRGVMGRLPLLRNLQKASVNVGHLDAKLHLSVGCAPTKHRP